MITALMVIAMAMEMAMAVAMAMLLCDDADGDWQSCLR